MGFHGLYDGCLHGKPNIAVEHGSFVADPARLGGHIVGPSAL